MKSPLILRTTLLILLLTPLASGENWPGWRGPRGDGTAKDSQIPTQWDGETGKNIAWKYSVPGTGHSSPIIWGDRIFLVSCLEDTNERLLLCIDRTTGKQLWQESVLTSALETKHRVNSFASGTPATDGRTIYATFLVVEGHEIPAKNVGKPRGVTPGEIVVVAYDFDGHKLWTAAPGGFTSVHGFCSSPVIFEDLLIINGDHDGDSYIAALDRQTGKQVWKMPREHKTRSYCTPLVRTIDGKTQMVLTGSKRIISLDPRTGKQHWLIEGPTEQFVSSMVYDGKEFYGTAGFPTHHVMGIHPNGTDDVTDSHVAWHSKMAKCYVPSPVLAGNYLFVADDRGTANCFDPETGERIWQDRLGKHYSSSLTAANGLVYFIADDGITKIVRPGRNLEIVCENPLGEYTFASPAMSDGQIFIRGEQHLFAIGRRTTRP